VLQPVVNFNFSGHQQCKDCSNECLHLCCVYWLAFILV